MQATADIVYDVLLGGAISLDNTGQKDKAFFMKKKNHSCLVTLAFWRPKESPFNNKKPRYDIYLLNTVLFSSVMPAKRTATCMNTNIPIELS